MEHLSEQEQLRRNSLQALRDLGINPYPAEKFDVSAVLCGEVNGQEI